MCGLISVITKHRHGFATEQRDMFELLVYMDTLRGDDSTGAFIVDNIGNVEMAKEASPGWRYLAQPEYLKLRNKAFQNGWAMVGHNRKATRGTITDRNAHPFIVDDNIVLVHNGSYFGDHKHLKDTEVDSEALAHTISETDTVENALRKINAAYALIWYNTNNKELNMIRNMARPLWMMETDNAWVFASEDAFLQFIKSKFRFKLLQEPFEIEEYNHYKFKLKDDKDTELTITKLDCAYHKHNPTAVESTATFLGNSRQHFHEGYYDNYMGDCGFADDEVGKHFQRNQVANVPVTPILEPPYTPTLTRGGGRVFPLQIGLTERYDTKQQSLQNRFLDAIRADMKVMTYGQWLEICSKLKDGTTVKIVVKDVVEANDNPKSADWLMIGNVMIHPSVYSVFHFEERDFSKISAMAGEAIFEMTVNGVTWKRTESQDTIKLMNDWLGIVTVHGINPSPVNEYTIPTLTEQVINVH